MALEQPYFTQENVLFTKGKMNMTNWLSVPCRPAKPPLRY